MSNIPENYLLKLTLEIGPAISQGNSTIEKGELKRLLSIEIKKHPKSFTSKVFKQLLLHLEHPAENFAAEDAPIPVTMTDYYGPCGSCFHPGGAKGQLYISDINTTQCLRCR